jgi:hypothetical protein
MGAGWVEIVGVTTGVTDGFGSTLTTGATGAGVVDGILGELGELGELGTDATSGPVDKIGLIRVSGPTIASSEDDGLISSSPTLLSAAMAS